MLSKTKGMVATSMPDAADAGLRVLRSGGNAIDAAVATALAIAVVDPADSGLGGSGLATIYRRDAEDVTVVDFNAVCPSGISASTYPLLEGISKDTGYRRVEGDANVIGYKAIAVPGMLAGMDLLLSEYGTKKLSDVVRPAISLARNGFRTTRFVAEAIDWNLELMKRFPETAAVFAPNGPPGVGDTIIQRDLTETLKAISHDGADALYRGKVGERIVEAMAVNGGLITAGDLDRYEPQIVRPATTTYRGYEVSTPPIGSGGNALLEALNILENFDVGSLAYFSPEMVHLLIETLKLVWADRLVYDADPDFVRVPLQGLLSKDYARHRSTSIDTRRVMTRAKAGDPWRYDRTPGRSAKPRPSRPPGRDSHTTQVTVVDEDRNMVSLTQTVWGTFGSFITVPGTGIIMNNGQSRFDPDLRASNRPEVGKRVLSNMCPTIVTKDGRPVLATGTPGGRRIIATILGFLVSFIDYERDTDALNMPRLHCEAGEPVLLESAWADGVPLGTVRLLEKQGHRLRQVPISGAPYLGYTHISGPASAIAVKGKSLTGTADTRQPGAIRGY